MFSALREAIRAVRQLDLTALTDGELREAVATVHECETMLAAAATRLVGAAGGTRGRPMVPATARRG